MKIIKRENYIRIKDNKLFELQTFDMHFTPLLMIVGTSLGKSLSNVRDFDGRFKKVEKLQGGLF